MKRTIVFSRNELQTFDRFGIATFANSEFGRFAELDDRFVGLTSQNPARRRHTTHIAVLCCQHTCTKSNRRSYNSAKTPTRKDPLLTALTPTTRQGESGAIDSLAGGELRQDSSIKDKVSAAAKSKEADEQAEDDPVKGSASNDSEDVADHDRPVEGEFTADNVGGETPEKGAC